MQGDRSACSLVGYCLVEIILNQGYWASSRPSTERKGEARRISIDPKIVDASEKEVLEDLIVAAINDARAKVDARMSEEMGKLTGGLNLPPGLKLPF